MRTRTHVVLSTLICTGIVVVVLVAVLYPAGSAGFVNASKAAMYDAAIAFVRWVLLIIDQLSRDAAKEMDVGTASGQQRDIWTLQTVLNLFQIVGVPIAAILFIVRIVQESGKRRFARTEKENDRYESLQQEYISFLKLSMDNPELEFGPWPYTVDHRLTPREAYRRTQLGWVLITIFEKAFLLQHSMGRQRWENWDNYIKDYCSSQMFREMWDWDDKESHASGNQMDPKFEKYMNDLMRTVKVRSLTPYDYVREPLQTLTAGETSV